MHVDIFTPKQTWQAFLDSLPLSESEKKSYVAWLLGLFADGIRDLNALHPRSQSFAVGMHEDAPDLNLARWRQTQATPVMMSAADWLGV